MVMNKKNIFIMQIISLSLIWIFVAGISVWILNLLNLSLELSDVPSATIAISLVAIPVFVTIAIVLTYVFVGLQRGNSQDR
jgi:hypothetical protein